jgi:shikimate kinase
VWLRADLGLLLEAGAQAQRSAAAAHRDPEAVMRRLMEARYPVYAQADIVIDSRNASHRAVVCEVLSALARHLGDEDGQ